MATTVMYHNLSGTNRPNDLSYPFRLLIVSNTNRMLWNIGDVEIYEREDYLILGHTREELEKLRTVMLSSMEGCKTIMTEITKNTL